MNSIIGAVIAAIIAIATGALALLTATNVESLGDITQIQWIVLGVGGLITFLKDWQAISVRRGINTVTKAGEGGGIV